MSEHYIYFSCEEFCPSNTYGYHCEHQCICENDAKCVPDTGQCNCTAGMSRCGHIYLVITVFL